MSKHSTQGFDSSTPPPQVYVTEERVGELLELGIMRHFAECPQDSRIAGAETKLENMRLEMASQAGERKAQLRFQTIVLAIVTALVAAGVNLAIEMAKRVTTPTAHAQTTTEK